MESFTFNWIDEPFDKAFSYNNDDDVIYDHQLGDGRGWICQHCICLDGCDNANDDDMWKRKLCSYAEDVYEYNYEFHYGDDVIEICEREEQIKKMFNKLINEDVEHISNYIFSFI